MPSPLPIAAGLITYRVVYGTTTGGVDTDVATVTDLVCGDAFIIEGQSNALATDNSAPNDTTTTNQWVRTYGLTSGWGYAISKGNDLQLGLWGWYLANRLVTDNNMPDLHHQRRQWAARASTNTVRIPRVTAPRAALYSIYANLYNRVVGAKLTHGIRGLFWHQGEQDQGSGGTGRGLRLQVLSTILRGHFRRLETGLPESPQLLPLPDLAGRLRRSIAQRPTARSPADPAVSLFQHEDHEHPRHRAGIKLPL